MFNQHEGFAEENLNKQWYWDYDGGLNTSPVVTPELVGQFIDKTWVYDGLNTSPVVTSEFVGQFIDKAWGYGGLNTSPVVTSEFVGQSIDKAWGYDGLNTSPVVAQESVEKFIDKTWDYDGLITNSDVATNIADPLSNWDGFFNLTPEPITTPIFVEKYLEGVWVENYDSNTTPDPVEKTPTNPLLLCGWGCRGLDEVSNTISEPLKKYLNETWGLEHDVSKQPDTISNNIEKQPVYPKLCKWGCDDLSRIMRSM